MAAFRPPSCVLVVGSIPLPTALEVFTKACTALPGRLHAVPDGEVGERGNFIGWQLRRFPSDAIRFALGGTAPAEGSKPQYDKLEAIQPTGYDDAAIASYAEFLSLRAQGVIPKGVRFQVCLPTPFNCIVGHTRPEFHERLEPLYERRMQEALTRIVSSTPADDLVIQWDLCFDVVALEYERGTPLDERFKAYFSPVMQGILDRLVLMCSGIPPAIPLAFHLCYGDLRHKHFVEPADLSLLVDLANEIIRTLGNTHKIDWMHMPVPQDRNDNAYFEPLKNLKSGLTRLYLGVIHANDERGARDKIEVARSIYEGDFGVSTECGLGRTPIDDLDSIFAIAKAVTEPRESTYQ
ncbi:MAG: hypothetical protein Q9160_002958 [Pyrenula sp. 1 TL-2023]